MPGGKANTKNYTKKDIIPGKNNYINKNKKRQAAESPGLLKPAAKKITLDITEKNKKRVLEFASEEDRRGWQKAYRKSKLHIPYFLVGIGINFLLYFGGLNLSGNLLAGALVGLAVPLACMFILSELHYRLLIDK